MTDTTVQPNIAQPEETDTQRVALLVEYCGDAFFGSQYQPGKPTVQASIQDALGRLNLRTSAVSFAGRTDAGVNAHGQVAHFDIPLAGLSQIPDLPSALNAVLPDTVSVRAAHCLKGRAFNSRRDAVRKWYRYTIYNAMHRSVWAARVAATHYRQPLSTERMQQATSYLLGVHDFRSFKDSDTEVTNDICDIQYANVARDGDFIIFDLVADRFLYKMVRNITGQLMQIGRLENNLTAEHIVSVMEARDRRQAAATARPEGLTLMAIEYKPPFNFFAQDASVRQLQTMFNPMTMESQPHENVFRKAS